jgi:hypothetical protein
MSSGDSQVANSGSFTSALFLLSGSFTSAPFLLLLSSPRRATLRGLSIEFCCLCRRPRFSAFEFDMGGGKNGLVSPEIVVGENIIGLLFMA